MALAFCVEAEDEVGKVFRWDGGASLDAPLWGLARRWASAHRVSEEAVGFEAAKDSACEVDLACSPAQLGWSDRNRVCLFAFPRSSPDRVASAASGAAAVVSPRPPRKRPVDEAAEFSGAKAAKKVEAKGKAIAPAVKAGPAAKAVPAAKVAVAPIRGDRYKEYDGTPLPENDERIVFNQENAKRLASSGWERYEKYKKAKTLDQALSLGAAKGDIAHDWKKGFFRRA